MPTPKYNLSPEEAKAWLNAELEEMRQHHNRAQLADLDPDTAFELGYETALFDLARVTGDDPMETGIITFTPKENS